MTKLVNRAKMTAATTGTGTITLGSAVDGFQTFLDAGVADGDVVRYVIEDNAAWEIGTGTYTAGTPPLLSRTPSESSSEGAPINLSGNAKVYLTAAAADLQELVDFADNFVLPTSDGSTGQVLTTNGAGTLSFTTITGYTNSDVDAHLNTSTAASGEVLSWNGSDYDWVKSGGAFSEDAARNVYAVATIPAVTTGSDNLFYGSLAGDEITSGTDNIGLGRQSLNYVTTGTRNVGVGLGALAGSSGSKLTGSYNIGLGYLTGFRLSTGTDNFMAGDRAGNNLTSGSNNFLGGRLSGTNLTTGSNNVAIGNGALDTATTGGRNIAIGQDAMGLGVATAASGDNVAIGYQAGYDLTTGSNNVAIGQRALEAATTGSKNIAIGRYAGGAITGASENTYVGDQAATNITGNNNTAVGYFSLYGGASSSTLQSSAFGYLAGYRITTGIRNTFLGAVSGYDATTGITTGSNNTLVGYEAEASSATVSNEITLGNASITTLRCQVTTITSLSDARDKTDIQPLNAGLEFVNALEPVSFTWNMRDGGKVGEADTGFIAQDLKRVQEETGVTIPHLVFDANPEKLEAGYGKLIPVLVQAIKDLSAKVEELEARLEGK